MRRKPLMLLVAAVLVPVTVLATTASASAASGSLTVTTYNRQGAKVAIPLVITNTTTNQQWNVTSGKAKSLPKGTYTVLAAISSKDGSDTLGARVLKLTGKTSTTIDARWGKPLRYNLDKNPGGAVDVHASLCTPGSGQGVDAYNSSGKVFVIPNSSTHVRSAFATVWGGGTNEQWVVAYEQKTIPATLTRTVKRSSLATLTSTVKKGVSGAPDVMMAIQGEGTSGDCRQSLFVGLNRVTAPFTMRTHMSGGRWLVRTSAETDSNETTAEQWVTKSFTGGKSYAQTFYRAAWGPGNTRPETSGNRIMFNTDSMFTDPGFQWADLTGWQVSEKSTVWLSKGGKQIKSQSRSSWGDGNPAFEASTKKKGWYLLKVSAQRYHPGVSWPSDLLANKTSMWMSFYANPAKERTVPVAVPRLSPNGLDMSNRAKPGSTTTVDIKVQGTAARTVTAKASFDNGKTWKTVSVRKSGTIWKATVKNPVKGGMIGLRTQAKTQDGYTTEVTVYRAYRVG
ncbi:Subtilisin-like protein serine protease-like protein [Actinoplanes sp. N902-109]|nr:Subtilisin-like protein serine protease-like protein [Actinoplanes sp. N902-109]